jgi:hypothetical protein
LRPLVKNGPAFSESPFARHRSRNCADGCRPPTPRSTACPSPFPDRGSPFVALTCARSQRFPIAGKLRPDERIDTPSSSRGTFSRHSPRLDRKGRMFRCWPPWLDHAYDHTCTRSTRAHVRRQHFRASSCPRIGALSGDYRCAFIGDHDVEYWSSFNAIAVRVRSRLNVIVRKRL